MRKRLLASLALPILLVSGVASAATVQWRSGETAPPTEIVPMSPTDQDTVSFTAATPPYLNPFSNGCYANRVLGMPMISIDMAAHAFSVEFTPADPSTICPEYYAPVNGIEGELGKLEPGPWTLTITNVNDPYMNTTLHFSVASTPTVKWRSGETVPPTEIVPMSPTDQDTVSFTAATPPYRNPFSNDCYANRVLGRPMISIDMAAHAFSVEFTPADPSMICLDYEALVNGIEGELGRLEPGPWTLTITNDNNPYMNTTLPFTVRLAVAASGQLILHTRANDQTTGTQFPFDRPFFIAQPLGAHCNPENGGMTCGETTLQRGAPLRGTTAIDIGPSASFTLPRYALKATATGSLPLYGPYQTISTYADGIANGTGFFKPGGGPGKRTFSVPGSGGPAARIAIRPGANQFGGTLGMLGAIGSSRAHIYKNKTFVGNRGFLKTVLGRSCTGTGCLLPTSYPTATIYMKYQTSMGKATIAYMTPWGLPWTTGAVSITATHGPFPTRFRRSGYDKRTAKGLGTIQMVAPHLVKWDFRDRSAPWDREVGTIGVLRIKFVPEPSGWAMLAAGAALIAAFWSWRRRSGTSNR